jgi:hypothetical protein
MKSRRLELHPTRALDNPQALPNLSNLKQESRWNMQNY